MLRWDSVSFEKLVKKHPMKAWANRWKEKGEKRNEGKSIAVIKCLKCATVAHKKILDVPRCTYVAQRSTAKLPRSLSSLSMTKLL